MSGDKKQRWVPLESNPEVLNKYVHNLGVPKEWEFVDVYGLDPELLMMVPRPVIAVMLLYPITEQSEKPENKIGEERTTVDTVYYMKQTVGNACGTVAVIHALANNRDNIKFEDNKHFNKFLEDTLGKEPDQIANILENDEAMGAAHGDSAQEGQTEAPSRDEKINTHFIAFVCRNSGLYELVSYPRLRKMFNLNRSNNPASSINQKTKSLDSADFKESVHPLAIQITDGRKSGPVFHGSTTPDSLLEDTIEVVRKFMERDPTQLNFTLMALAKV